MDAILQDLEPKMTKCIEHFEIELAKIQTGRAHPSILDGLMVTVYGAPTPVNQMATVNVPEARMLVLRPYDKNNLKALEDAIRNSNLGLNPTNDGDYIRISIPALTEERRKELVKDAKKEAENAKVAIRQVRQDFNHKAKNSGEPEDMIKWAEEQVQKATDKFVKIVDEKYTSKEKDLMTI